MAAEALVGDARARGLELAAPSDVVEDPGSGIEGRVDGHVVTVGSADWLRGRGYSHPATPTLDDGAPGARRRGWDDRRRGGDDRPRSARGGRGRGPAAVKRHRARGHGLGRPSRRGRRAGREIGVDQVYAEQSPEAKLDVVRAMRADAHRRPVLMVGDGVNDAPALALADVGIAMGAGGATVSSQTADAVITVDRIDRVADAVEIGVARCA